MSGLDYEAMGTVGLPTAAKRVAEPVAAFVARRTGRSTSQILALVGAGFLALSVIQFLRTVDSVVSAGRPHDDR
jgi:hypothetical protein